MAVNAEKAKEIPVKKKKKSKKKILVLIPLILFLIAMLGVVLYPAVSNILAVKEASEVRTDYEKTIQKIDTSELDEAYQAAIEYNETLVSGASTLDWEKVNEASKNYHNLLNVSGSGIMAYVEIPLIDVSLPIYHGDDSKSLEKGVAHLLGTSLPVGGKNTHSALSAHTGLSSQKMFTDLEELENGDIFFIHVLNRTLAYQVDDIRVVLPEDMNQLQIVLGEDYVTLITCTPYSVNTHRLLVRGTRVPYEEAVEQEKVLEQTRDIESPWEEQYKFGLLIGLAIVGAIVVIWLFFIFIKKQRKKKRKMQKLKELEAQNE